MSKKNQNNGILPLSRRIEMGLVKRPAKLTPSLVKRINDANAKYNQQLAATRVTYPTAIDFGDITEEMAKSLGFLGKSTDDLVDGLDQFGFSVAKKSKGGAKPKSLPDPKVVADFIKKRIAPLPMADLKGPVHVFSQNFEFLTPDKVKYFAESYKAIFPHFHAVTATEVSPDGAKAMSKLVGWDCFYSGDNTRGGQAVVIFYDPKRLKPVGGANLIDEVANVQGVNDLRPMLWVKFTDTVTGDEVNLGVNHLKSMRGGPQATGVIRNQQAKAIVKGLPKGWEGIMGGDWNCRMNDGYARIDLKPLIDDGFVLVDEQVNKLPTHVMGGWLDGFFARTTKTVSGMTVVQWFLDTKRDLTDHAGVAVSFSK